MSTINFVYVNIQIPGFDSFNRGFEGTLINHGVASLLSVLKQRGHQVHLIDFRKLKSWNEWNKICQGRDADFWCFSYLSTDYLHGQRAIRMLKEQKPSAKIIVGGAHASLSEEIEREVEVDFIVKGEGEEILPDIIEAIAPPRSHYPPIDLDSLPSVDREAFDYVEMNFSIFPELEIPMATIVTGRGCIFSCFFCNDRTKLNGTPRMRSVNNVIAELKDLDQKIAWKSLMWHDDLIAKQSWLEEFIEEYGHAFGYRPFFAQIHPLVICKQKDVIAGLAKIGFTYCSLGIESGSNRILEFINKQSTVDIILEAVSILRQNKVKIFGNYILGGFPTETKAEVLETAALIEEIQPERHSPSFYTAFPGSKLYDYCKENGLLLNEHWGTRSPWEIKVKGIDYGFLERLKQRLLAGS